MGEGCQGWVLGGVVEGLEGWSLKCRNGEHRECRGRRWKDDVKGAPLVACECSICQHPPAPPRREPWRVPDFMRNRRLMRKTAPSAE